MKTDNPRDLLDDLWVVVIGNPFQGMSIHGPFENSTQAWEWTKTLDSRREISWWVMPILEAE